MLTIERKVSASTHNQALSAILFLYREVLAIKLPWLDNIGRSQQKRRIPSVMTRDEVAGLLAQMEGETALLARLLYGTGMRLMEGIRLRVKDVDFDRLVIIVREFLCTPCAIPLLHICCRLAPTYARCKSCWGILMCRPP